MMMVVVVVISSNDFPFKSQYNPYKVGPQGPSLFAISVFYKAPVSQAGKNSNSYPSYVYIYIYQQT